MRGHAGVLPLLRRFLVSASCSRLFMPYMPSCSPASLVQYDCGMDRVVAWSRHLRGDAVNARRAGWPTASLLRAVLGACVVAIVLVLGLAPAGAAPAPEAGEKRIALVIGISAYQNAPPLVNPVNDARAIGEALRRLNFEVHELFDPDNRQFSRGI